MEKIVKKIFVAASLLTLGYLAFIFLNTNALDAIRLEIQRYHGFNSTYIVWGISVVFGSYIFGWIYSKLRQE